MAKQTKARFDRKGLTGLGLEKLVDILLEESVSNKALKSRLLTALAGASGADEIARLIDRRLDELEKARTSINSARARDLAVELSGLMRNIQSELGATDAVAGFERLMRLLGLRNRFEQRLRADSAKLRKVFSEAEAAVAEIALTLPIAEQVTAVPQLEKQRKHDRYAERLDFFANLLRGLAKPAADEWQALLEAQLKAVDPAQYALRLLQRLFAQNGNLDGYVALEKTKPDNRQDAYGVARMLYNAGRPAEALDWLRRPIPTMRFVYIDGIAGGVGPGYQMQERRLLEADILDAMKERAAAQALRWSAFLETFDPEILRRYIAKLDDFAEFDELDKAFAAVLASRNIYPALLFLVEWPKLDLAARHVLAHAKKWDGGEYEVLFRAAEALAEAYPVAATVLYRALLSHILDRGLSDAYEDAAHYMRTLATLSLRLPENPPFIDHAAYVGNLQTRHGRKYGFWQRIPLASG